MTGDGDRRLLRPEQRRYHTGDADDRRRDPQPDQEPGRALGRGGTCRSQILLHPLGGQVALCAGAKLLAGGAALIGDRGGALSVFERRSALAAEAGIAIVDRFARGADQIGAFVHMILDGSFLGIRREAARVRVLGSAAGGAVAVRPGGQPFRTAEFAVPQHLVCAQVLGAWFLFTGLHSTSLHQQSRIYSPMIYQERG